MGFTLGVNHRGRRQFLGKGLRHPLCDITINQQVTKSMADRALHRRSRRELLNVVVLSILRQGVVVDGVGAPLKYYRGYRRVFLRERRRLVLNLSLVPSDESAAGPSPSVEASHFGIDPVTVNAVVSVPTTLAVAITVIGIAAATVAVAVD